MKAAMSIGRVRGLAFALGVSAAVSLGVGVAVFAGVPAASADTGPRDGGSAVSATKNSPKADNGVHRSAARGSAPSESGGITSRNRSRPNPVAARVRPATALSAAPRATAASTASVSLGNSISVNPDVAWSNGLLLGSLNAVSGRGLELTYKVLKHPSLGGKVAWAPTPTGDPQPDLFSYLPYMTTLSNPGQGETFTVMVAEVTGFDKTMKKIPVIGLFVDPVLGILHRVPILNTVLAPIIGSAKVVPFDESAAALAEGRPTDFTYLMPSFDGTLISVNYYPALNVAAGDVTAAPTIYNGPDLGFPGNTDVFTPWDPSLVNIVPGINALRTDASPLEGGYVGDGGYNVITWDPRGEWASGGRMQLDNPNFEGRDVSSIITWSTSDDFVAQSQIATDEGGDPYVGMIGGSYGGGIQLAVAGTPDKRVDAIVPSIAWNTLNQSLYPNNAFKTAIGSELLLALIATGARINHQIYLGIATGALFGWLSSTSQALLANAGPGILTNNITAPSLFLQGTPDILFELNASQANGQMITTSNPGVPVKTTWFCGGHGVCLLPQTDQAEQGKVNMNATLMWLDQYVAGSGTPADTLPTFQWFDQTGAYHSSSLNPFDPAFNNPTPLTFSGSGGSLLLVPLLGGSGPSKAAVPPDKPTTFSTAFSLASGSKARNALNVSVTPEVGTVIAAAPTLSFNYSGLGTSKTVYAQLVDNATGLVVGNIVTPVPVTLDGRQRTVEIPMAPAAYEVYNSGDSLTLQITSSATPYANLTAWGYIRVADITLEIPTVA